MIDRFTYYVLDFFEQKRVGYDSKNSLKQLVRSRPPHPMNVSWPHASSITVTSVCG